MPPGDGTVVPFAGTVVETFPAEFGVPVVPVVPFAGTVVETHQPWAPAQRLHVVPFAGTVVETLKTGGFMLTWRSCPSRAR